MILSGKEIRNRMIVHPHVERLKMTREDGLTLSYGEGYAGYDIRVEFDAEGDTEYFCLAHGGFVLCASMEHFSMPDDVLGIVHDKSTWARRGLAVQNTVLEPGWRGWLTLELTNHGHLPIWLHRGDPIAQIIFHEVLNPSGAYAGKYQNQARGPQGAV